MNILFVMKHRGNAGSTHAIANYMRVAPQHGHSVAIYGEPVWYVPELQFSKGLNAFDRVVFLFESELYRISRLQEVAMLASFKRNQRLILDADGMYNPLLIVDGYDFNHRNDTDRVQWIAHMDALADRVVQTTFLPTANPHVRAMTFFGYNPALQIEPAAAPPKQYDVLHVGHNWWRWKEVADDLLPAFEQIRADLGEIGFIGLWWDEPPAEGPAAGPEEAFRSDPQALRRLRIQMPKAVMYHDVIKTMSTGRINILTQRPVLRRLRHLTLKYFEVFCADTIPLLMLDHDHAEAVYGPAAGELVLTGQVAAKILDALRRPEHYRTVVADIRRYLTAHYSYDDRIEELVQALKH